MTHARLPWLPPAWGQIALQRGLSLLFQKTCLHCRAPEGDPLCADCLAMARTLPMRRCPRCQGSLDGAGACMLCARADVPFEAVLALGAYTGTLQAAIRAMKYRGRADLGLAFGQELAELAAGWTDERWLVVPVPIHARRRAERGYNQAEPLAWRVARCRAWEYDPLAVRRLEHSPPSYQQGREERWSKAQLAYGADARRLEGRSVVVVDDILTSGATLWAIARAAREAGARRVRSLVLARAAMRTPRERA